MATKKEQKNIDVAPIKETPKSIDVAPIDELDNAYIVQTGDTLWAIASKLLGKGSRCSEIKAINNLTDNEIKVGQKIKIPNN